MTCDKTQSGQPHAGHRARLRQRFLQAGPSSLQDYEVLEMLIGFARPLIDTKPIAKSLLASFNDLKGVIGADISQLRSVVGIGEMSIVLLKIVHETVCRFLRSHISTNKPILDNPEEVINYCRAKIGYLSKEVNLILFLNNKNGLISTELRFEGTVDHSHTYPREIIAKALEVGAKAIIMVHNHPSGDPTPSPEDIEVTKNMNDIADLMNISLHDHLIIGRHTAYSMREGKVWG